jgi:hypothetical protein
MNSMVTEWNGTKRMILLIAVGYSGLVFTAACSARLSGSSDRATLPFPSISVKAIWPAAMEKAQEWQSDAYVANLRLSFNHTEDGGEFDAVDFAFESPTSDEHSLWVICDSTGCASDIMPKPANPSGIEPLPIYEEDFKIEGKKALEISLAHGGAEYIDLMKEKYIPTFAMLARMDPPDTGNLYWRASYFDPATREHLDVIIDANSGEVIDVLE